MMYDKQKQKSILWMICEHYLIVLFIVPLILAMCTCSVNYMTFTSDLPQKSKAANTGSAMAMPLCSVIALWLWLI